MECIEDDLSKKSIEATMNVAAEYHVQFLVLLYRKIFTHQTNQEWIVHHEDAKKKHPKVLGRHDTNALNFSSTFISPFSTRKFHLSWPDFPSPLRLVSFKHVRVCLPA